MDIAREDLSLFLNACAVATAQQEFYSSDSEQQVSLQFLHQYICVNYRQSYARTLAAGLNHFNQCEIIFQLLSSGKACPDEQRKEENALITAALRDLPPQRAWKLFLRIRKERINNRRTRKIIQGYIAGRKDAAFDAVKYRAKFKAAIQHSHMKLKGEVAEFLFDRMKKSFETPLLEQYRVARFSKAAVFNLPYSVAEGFAARHKISREEFLSKIQDKLTERERLRLQSASDGKVEMHPERLSLTELCVYILSLPIAERYERRVTLRQWLDAAVGGTLANMGAIPLSGKVAAVLDNSYSAGGSQAKRNRPLAVALASHHLLWASLKEDYRSFWLRDQEGLYGLYVYPVAQSHLTERVLDALEWGAETVVIISDGCENDVPGAADAVFKAYRKMGGKANFIHLNPVFDSESYQVHSLFPDIPALGLRVGEDLATTLAFGKFSAGASTFAELEGYLKRKADELVKGQYAQK